MRFTKRNLKAILLSVAMLATGIVPTQAVAGMSNYSKNRLHSNGNTAVYPTFVNEGNRVTLNGDVEIAKITLKAKKNIKKFNIKATDGIIVDKHLNSIKF